MEEEASTPAHRGRGGQRGRGRDEGGDGGGCAVCRRPRFVRDREEEDGSGVFSVKVSFFSVEVEGEKSIVNSKQEVTCLA